MRIFTSEGTTSVNPDGITASGAPGFFSGEYLFKNSYNYNFTASVTKTGTGVIAGSVVNVNFNGFGATASDGDHPEIYITIKLGSTELYNSTMADYVETYGNHGSVSFSDIAPTNDPVLTFIINKTSNDGNPDLQWYGFTYSSCAPDADGDSIPKFRLGQ